MSLDIPNNTWNDSNIAAREEIVFRLRQRGTPSAFNHQFEKAYADPRQTLMLNRFGIVATGELPGQVIAQTKGYLRPPIKMPSIIQDDSAMQDIETQQKIGKELGGISNLLTGLLVNGGFVHVPDTFYRLFNGGRISLLPLTDSWSVQAFHSRETKRERGKSIIMLSDRDPRIANLRLKLDLDPRLDYGELYVFNPGSEKDLRTNPYNYDRNELKMVRTDAIHSGDQLLAHLTLAFLKRSTLGDENIPLRSIHQPDPNIEPVIYEDYVLYRGAERIVYATCLDIFNANKPTKILPRIARVLESFF